MGPDVRCAYSLTYLLTYLCAQLLESPWVQTYGVPRSNEELTALSWWCDVARKGCLRPKEGTYPLEHDCWQVCSSGAGSAPLRSAPLRSARLGSARLGSARLGSARRDYYTFLLLPEVCFQKWCY